MTNQKSFTAAQRYSLTTSRNKNLILQKEQDRLRDTVICFFGLSVGSHAAITWMMESRANDIKIADPDTIEPTNLNRLRFGWDSVGKLKTSVVRTQLRSIHPDTHIFVLGATDPQSIATFIHQIPKTDILVDETDDLPSKILFRVLARDLRIPIICATDVGDNVFVDIERYDLAPMPSPFLGRIDVSDVEKLASMPPKERMRLIIDLVGLEHNSEAMLDSLLSIGKTITTWPQLGATATIAGGVVTTVLKKIILNESVLSGRYILSLDDIFSSDFRSQERKEIRKQKILQIRRQFS